jgi:hypothetical protein
VLASYLSKIFLSCNFRFFSSALLEEAVGADADEEDEASAGAADFLARFAGGGCAANSSSSYQRERFILKLWYRVVGNLPG